MLKIVAKNSCLNTNKLTQERTKPWHHPAHLTKNLLKSSYLEQYKFNKDNRKDRAPYYYYFNPIKNSIVSTPSA